VHWQVIACTLALVVRQPRVKNRPVRAK